MNEIDFEEGLFGTKATLRTYWRPYFLELLLDNDVRELELNDGKGWYGENVDFLESLSGLRALTIIDFTVKSIEAIYNLKNLIKLEISTYTKKSIDFSNFPKLIECGFEWIKGSDSLFQLAKLKKLFINSYDGKTSHMFAQLICLEDLSIMNSKIEELNGISSLIQIRKLRLSNLKNLIDLKGLENLRQLIELEIQRCKKVTSINEIFHLVCLRSLSLLDMGDILNLDGIQNLANLSIFLFYESTNILDGDLSPIVEIKSLAKISYQNRRHYTHKREDFGEKFR